MSFPHLDPSALTQVTPSINTTMASAAEARAPNSSASHRPSWTNSPPIEAFASTKTTNTKVKVDSFETCVISQETTLQESTGKASRMMRKMLVRWICFPCPPGLMQAQSGAQLLT